MKLELPEKMLKETVLVKFKNVENLGMLFKRRDDYYYNWYTSTNYDIREEHPEVEYIIKYGDRVNVSIDGALLEGNFMGLSSNFRFLVSVCIRGNVRLYVSHSIEPIAKESPVLVKARETLVDAKATVEAAQRIVDELEC